MRHMALEEKNSCNQVFCLDVKSVKSKAASGIDKAYDLFNISE